MRRGVPLRLSALLLVEERDRERLLLCPTLLPGADARPDLLPRQIRLHRPLKKVAARLAAGRQIQSHTFARPRRLSAGGARSAHPLAHSCGKRRARLSHRCDHQGTLQHLCNQEGSHHRGGAGSYFRPAQSAFLIGAGNRLHVRYTDRAKNLQRAIR